MIKKTTLLYIVCGLSLTVNALFVWMYWPYFDFSEKTNAMRERSAMVIQVSTVKQEPIARKKTFSGTIKAISAVQIISEIPGRIKKINFKQGEIVTKGTILIQLDDRQAKALLAEAEAQVKVTQANYDRQLILFNKSFGAKSALEQAQGQLASALASQEKARVNNKLTRIKAPFDGKIGLINVSEGASVSPNQEITRLVSSNPMEVEFNVPEADVKDIHLEQDVDVLAEGYDSLPVIGKITAIAPYSDPVAHTITVKAMIDNSENKFRDGAFASVTISLAYDENAIVVSKEAIVHERDQDFVFVIVNNRAQQRSVIVGVTDESRAQITDGLKPGEIVAIDPVELLSDGIPVRIDTQMQ